MDIRNVMLTIFIGLVSGYVGSSLHAINNDGRNSRNILISDKISGNSIFLGFEKDNAKLEFRDPNNKEVGSIGFSDNNAYLNLRRMDGSAVSITPNDESAGYHLMMLKSMGEGKGLYMSMLTSDDIYIHQSGVGSLVLGDTLYGFGLRVYNKDEKKVLLNIP